ncbi:hypothetical protein UFOVP238_50 [uncultured Caudovirales phage]|uniref:Calcineurin-like phosphoesterase domain-containing protein n=1 Tax=uncultured Caudovirales phage TaxID=2100421 RepID=A0A6J7WUQ7_9CAUD|nr:hypothetical protein UFOVP238_50 [uncultured Caudovirales phage]
MEPLQDDVTRTHLVIPDTQAKPGVPTDHLYWIGQYIVDRKPDVIVHLGDHADMESLSSYDVGKRVFEGRRYKSDIEAANEAFDILCAPLVAHNAMAKAHKKAQYHPERHLLLGNHEDRINRATNDDSKLDGTIGVEDLNYIEHGWNVHPFLKPVEIDGVHYAHYWAAPMTGRPYGGTAANRLSKIGHSFTMGHQQTLDYAVRFLSNGQQQNGLVAGACYLHDEAYKSFQGNAHWRGIIVKHEVSDGAYDPMFVSLSYLCRKYEGMTLERFLSRKY